MNKNKKALIPMTILGLIIVCSALFIYQNNTSKKSKAGSSQRQVEKLDRGLVAVKTSSGILVSWRLLGTESYGTTFNVYRDGTKIASKVSGSTNYLDASGTTSNKYYVTSVVSSTEVTKSNTVQSWSSNYLDVAIKKPAGGTNTSGSYTYSANDASVGDVDGDGVYEIILKWDPSNSKDNSQSGYTGNVYLDCYELNGTQLWRIDLGCNVRAGAHYSPFMVYDFNGDGTAEVACRTAYGSIDGTGQYVNASSAGYNTKDYRNSSGYVLSGTEFLTVFSGATGDTLKSVEYTPQRGTVSSWGDSYGNRVDRFLAGVAYCDGKTPYLIMCRGYYTRAVIVAYAWDGTNLTKKWTYDTGSSTSKTSSAYGQGAHSLSVADVDSDGYDEIVYGSAVIDHTGSLLYSTGRGHGDALHVSDFNNDGKQEVFMVHEDSAYYAKYGAEFRNGATGAVIASVGASADVGRGVMANVTSSSGAEFWSTATGYLYNKTGVNVGNRPGSVNFSILWDGDLLSELMDKTAVSKYNESTKSTSTLQSFASVHSNNSTKATPSLQADIFGDYREEVILGGTDDTYLRIYTTNVVSTNKLYTLMHDTQYRTAIAWQNSGYNQPPHTSFYIGSDMSTPSQPSIYTVGSKATSLTTLTPAATTSSTNTSTTKAAAATAAATSSSTSTSSGTSYGWNFDTSKFRSLGTISATKNIDNLTINATAAKTVQVISDTATISGVSLNYSLALGGAGNTTYRSLKIPVGSKSTIKVYLRSGNSTVDRTLVMGDGSGNSLSTVTAPKTPGISSFTYSGSAGYVYLYSSNSGINIYKIEVTNQ